MWNLLFNREKAVDPAMYFIEWCCVGSWAITTFCSDDGSNKKGIQLCLYLYFIDSVLENEVGSLLEVKLVPLLFPVGDRNVESYQLFSLLDINMPTSDQCEAMYHCGIDKILTAAYQREFTMLGWVSVRPNFLHSWIGMQRWIPINVFGLIRFWLSTLGNKKIDPGKLRVRPNGICILLVADNQKPSPTWMLSWIISNLRFHFCC